MIHRQFSGEWSNNFSRNILFYQLRYTRLKHTTNQSHSRTISINFIMSKGKDKEFDDYQKLMERGTF